MTKTLKHFTAATLAAVLFALSPGLPAYQLFAQTVARPVPSGMNMPATPVVNAVLPGVQGSLNQGQTLQNGALPTLNVLPAVRVQAAASRSDMRAAAAPAAAAAAAPIAAKSVLPAAVAPGVARSETSAEVRTMAAEVGKTLRAAGELASASAENARGVGSKIQAILTGARFNAAEDSSLTPAVEIGGVRRGFELAKPAGRELADTVGAFNVQEAVPAPSEQTEQPQPPSSRKSPTWPKFLAAGLAFLPAVLLGWPLIAAGGTVGLALGAATVAASVLLAALPFMGAGTPKAVRMIPGFALSALGFTAAFAAFTLGTGYAAAALVALGGWGLVRYGKSEDSRRGYDNEYALSAFFGALGAAALPVLALMPHAGIVATVLLVGSYLSSALLLMHLPSWVGIGITVVVLGLVKGTEGIHRVESSMRRDTVLFDRLTRFSKEQLARSPWNAVWLAGIWIPVGLSELVQGALSIVVGAAVGAMQAPVMFLWGASYKIAGKTRVTVFFAEWARSMFDNVQAGKKSIFNPLIKPLLPYVNSKNKLVSLPASLALRLAQWGWLVYALVGTPVLGLVGFVRAFGKSAAAYDDLRHDPALLKVRVEDSAGDNTEEPGPADPSKPGKPALAPRIIATTLALLPAGFFGVPMLLTMSPAFGGLYLGLTLALAALPFLPASAPKKLRQLPGVLLSAMGAAALAGLYAFFIAEPVTAMGAHTLLALAGLVGVNGFWMGALGLVGGWGLYRYLGRIVGEDGKSISPDDPEYIGAFFGATAAAAGLGAVLMGLSGWPLIALSGLAYLTSPLLLMHLPRWVWSGFGEAIQGTLRSVRGFLDVLTVVSEGTRFYSNLRKHANYWLDKTVWNGAWLSVIWVPVWLTQLAEALLAGALGVSMGVLRAPFNYAAGAFHRGMPGSRLDRFFDAMTETWSTHSEGSAAYEQFKRSNRRWLEGMNASAEPSGRPTFGAVLNGVAVRLSQAVWLAGTLLATPVMMAYGIYEGFKAAFAKPDGGTPGAVSAEPEVAPQSSASNAPQAPASDKQAGKATLRGIVFTGALGAVAAGVFMLIGGAHVGLGAVLLAAGSIAGTLALVAGRSNSDGEGGIALAMIGVFAAALAVAAAVLAAPVHFLLGLSWLASVGVAAAVVALAAGVYFYVWNKNSGRPHSDSRGTLSGFAAPGLIAAALFLGKAALGFGGGLALTALLYKLGVFKQSGGDITGPAGVFFNYAAMAVLGSALAVFAVPLWNLLAAATIPGVLWTVVRTILGGGIGLAAGVALYRSGAIDRNGGDITGPAVEFAIVASIGVLGALLGAFMPILLRMALHFVLQPAMTSPLLL